MHLQMAEDFICYNTTMLDKYIRDYIDSNHTIINRKNNRIRRCR